MSSFQRTEIKLAAQLYPPITKHHTQKDMIMKALWNNTVLAESDNTVVIDGNHYFPKSSINCQYFTESSNTSVCGWKGTANYFHIDVNGEKNTDAAWSYHTPKEAAHSIQDHVAFWKGVEVTQ